MTRDLRARDWRAIAELGGEMLELLDVAPWDLEGALAHFLTCVERFAGGEAAVLGSHAVCVQRERPLPADPLLGWRVLNASHHGIAAQVAKHRERWFLEGERYLADPLTQLVARTTGRHRALRRCDYFSDHAWARTSQWNEIERPFGIGSRLLVGFSLDERREIIYEVDLERSRALSERRTDLVLTAVEHLGWFHARFARHRGLAGARTPLSPREQATLEYLLTGLSEKEIAAACGLTERSLHQVVVTVYRKFGVRSRAELMALVLRGHPVGTKPTR